MEIRFLEEREPKWENHEDTKTESESRKDIYLILCKPTGCIRMENNQKNYPKFRIGIKRLLGVSSGYYWLAFIDEGIL